MFIRKPNMPRLLYRHLVLLTMVSFCIPTIAAGVIFYYNVQNEAIKRFESSNQNSVAIAADKMEKVFDAVELDILKLSNSEIVQDSFMIPGFAYRFDDQRVILDEISMRRSLSNYISEIMYFNAPGSLVLSNKFGGFIITDNAAYYKKITSEMMVDKLSYWDFTPDEKGNEAITYIRKLPVNAFDESDGLIAVQLDMNYLNDYLHADLFNKNSINFIINSDGNVLMSRNFEIYNKAQDISDDISISRIIGEKSVSGSFFSKSIDGESMLYTYHKSINGRIYISIVPRSEIIKQLDWSRWFVLVTFLVFLGCGSFLVLVSSKRVYNPIQKLLIYSNKVSDGIIKTQGTNEISYIIECLAYLRNEIGILNNYIDEINPTVAEKFFRKLMDGEYNNDTRRLVNDCDKYGIPLSCLYNVITLHIDNPHKTKLQSSMEKPMTSFSVTKIMENKIKAANNINGYVLKYQNRIVTILCFDETYTSENVEQLVNAFLYDVLSLVDQTLKTTVSFGVGRIFNSLLDISVSYDEAVKALQYRMYKNLGSVLHIDKLETSKNKTLLFYPCSIEKKILDCLKDSNLQTAGEAVKEFVDNICETESYNFIYQSYHMLLSSIILAFQSNGGNVQDLMENNLYDQLRECRTSLEMYTWFVNSFFPLYAELSQDSQQETGKSAILIITKYINENITKDISLVKCAELVSMSPAHVSRLFRKSMGTSFVDYVVNRKIEEIKRMLVETDCSVGDIASEVGYSERSIYRIFCKITGMSPTEYRVQNS